MSEERVAVGTMEICEMDQKSYEQMQTRESSVFSLGAFQELNRYKVENVIYLAGKAGTSKMAQAFGIWEGEMRSPFSAPFNFPILSNYQMRVEHYDQYVKGMISYAKNEKIKKIKMILPPYLYEKNGEISKFVNACLNNQFGIAYIDLNYYFDMKKIRKIGYENCLQRNARKNLRAAQKNKMKVKIAQTKQEKELAYRIIAQNRKERGFPLHMSYDQVRTTTEIVKCDSFLASCEERVIASAIVFYVNESVVQVVYWGNLGEGAGYRPVNFLAKEIVDYYGKDEKIAFIDVGPSTENGIPNNGLCDFKESIGCDVDSKITLVRDI